MTTAVNPTSAKIQIVRLCDLPLERAVRLEFLEKSQSGHALGNVHSNNSVLIMRDTP